MIDKRFAALTWSIQKRIPTKTDHPYASGSDLSRFQDELVDTIGSASQSVVSIGISKNVKVYVDDPSSMYGPWAVQEENTKIWGWSWIIVSKDGYIITNKHVVEDQDAKYSVILNDGKVYNVDKIRFDANLDVALLKIVDDNGKSPTDLPVATIVSMDDIINIGQFALAIGNSLSEFPNSVTMGIISARNRELKLNKNNLYIWLYQTDTSINPWNSGGPLLDIYGNVIGITTAMSTVWAGVAFALPITQEFVDATIKSVQQYAKIIRPLIGISYLDITHDLQKQMKLTVNNGVLIKDVFSDLPAAVAWIKVGDIITTINDHTIDQKTPFLYQLYTYTPDMNISLGVLRNWENMIIPITLWQNSN